MHAAAALIVGHALFNRFFSKFSLCISISKCCIASGNISSSMWGFLKQRVKNELIFLVESVELRESSINVSSICDIVRELSLLFNSYQSHCHRAHMVGTLRCVGVSISTRSTRTPQPTGM